MSTNGNDSMDVRHYTSRRSGLIDFDETNRMERPSRVFSSRHVSSINNMDQNEMYRRTNEYLNFDVNSYVRNGGNTINGLETQRTRSPFVRFTITDPETQRITATGQIPLNSPPHSSQINTLPTNTEIADVPINEESDDDQFDIRREQRRITDHLNAVMNEVNEVNQWRTSRFVRRTRRFTEHPYFMRNNLDTTQSNRIPNRRSVRFSANTHRLIDHPSDRSQTPEQELPEVLEQEMEPEHEEYEEVYHGQESISSSLSHNDADSDDDVEHDDDLDHDDDADYDDDDAGGDDRRSANLLVSGNPNSNADEENRDTLDLSNEIPRTRAVPFMISSSPLQLSPRTESLIDLLETPPLSTNNNVDNDDDNLNTPFRRDLFLPSSSLRYVAQGVQAHQNNVHNNNALGRLIDLEFNNTVNSTARTTYDTNSSIVNTNEIIDLINVDCNHTPIPQVVNCVPLAPVENQSEETAPIRVEEHPETYDDLNDQLTRLFECPVCFEHIVPPVYQCLLGHLICNKCVPMCDNCPTCRNPFNSKRNLYMEKVGYLVKFPCRNALTGCKQQMFIAQKQIHEQECCYRHYQCFFTNCAWKGYYPEMHVHMVNNHNNCILTGSDQVIGIMLPSNNQTYKWFLVAHNELFAVIAHTSTPPRRVKVQVNFIGPAVKAKQFKFTIILTEQKDPGSDQKLIYERSTLPYSEIYEMSNNSFKKDIFSVPGDVLEPFIKLKRRRLPVMLKITPVGL